MLPSLQVSENKSCLKLKFKMLQFAQWPKIIQSHLYFRLRHERRGTGRHSCSHVEIISAIIASKYLKKKKKTRHRWRWRMDCVIENSIFNGVFVCLFVIVSQKRSNDASKLSKQDSVVCLALFVYLIICLCLFLSFIYLFITSLSYINLE